MKYSKTTLMELSHRYSKILKKCALLNATILMGAMVASLPTMAGVPNTTGNAWVFGDISLANAPVSQAAIGGRRMAWNATGTKYKNDMPKYNMLGRSLFVTNSEMYVGPVTLTLRELTHNDAFAYNYQWDTDNDGVNDDVDMAQWAEITWSDAAGENGLTNVNNKVTAKIGEGNATYIAPGVYMFAQRDNSKNAGSMNFNGSILTVNGSTVNADSISMINSTMTVVKQNELKLDAFDGGDIDSDGITTLNANNINISGSEITVNSGAELSFNGNLRLNSSITNNGIVNFVNGSTLKTELNGSTIIAGSSGEIRGETALVLTDFFEGASIKFEGDKTEFKFSENALYDIILDGDEYKITKKSTEKIVENLTSAGATVQEAATISAIASSISDNAILKAISTAVQTGNVAQAAQAAKELAPTTSQQVMGVAQGVNNILSNVTGNRMSAMGRAGGDAFIGGALWVQGLYNHTKQDANASSDGFTANTRGIAFGIDGKVNEAITLGLGYGYTNTNADAGNNDVDVDGHNVFAYAQYQPNAWYVNGMISYGLSKYTEEKTPMGIAMKSKYDVDTYSANLTTGYDFENGFTPYGGLRYILAKQDGYNDGAQYIKSDDNDVLTAVAGVKYGKDFKADTWTVKPNIRLAATYDMISDNSVANVNIIGGSNYQITGERLKRFGVETGVGVEATWGDWNLSVDYNGSFKKDFQSHTGMLKAKYNF